MKKKNVKETNSINIPTIMRIAYIDRQISMNNYPSAIKLSKEYEVSSKTIIRTIEFMKSFYNAPIEYDKSIKGYFYSDKNFKLVKFDLNDEDLRSLALISNAFKIYGGKPFSSDLNSFFNKIYYIYNDKYSIQLKDIENIISFRIRNSRSVDTKFFEIIKTAIINSETLKCRYYSGYSGQTTDRELDPYHIVNDKGEWYLIAFCHRDNKIKLFSISRFKEVHPSGKQFSPVDDFNVEKFFEDSFGVFNDDKKIKVRMRFEKRSAGYIKEKTWHRSQIIKENKKDGSVILEMTVNSSDEIKHWVLSWGRSCTLLSPKTLVEEIKSDLKSTLKNYS